jgi:hypothetical protein
MAVFALYIFITYLQVRLPTRAARGAGDSAGARLQYLWGRIIINNSMEALGLPKPFRATHRACRAPAVSDQCLRPRPCLLVHGHNFPALNVQDDRLHHTDPTR